MKMAATLCQIAPPSMLTVAPMGRTNLEIRGSTSFLVSKHSMVSGRVAALEAVPNAVLSALPMLAINGSGDFFVIRRKMTGRMRPPCIASPEQFPVRKLPIVG